MRLDKTDCNKFSKWIHGEINGFRNPLIRVLVVFKSESYSLRKSDFNECFLIEMLLWYNVNNNLFHYKNYFICCWTFHSNKITKKKNKVTKSHYKSPNCYWLQHFFCCTEQNKDSRWTCRHIIHLFSVWFQNKHWFSML